MTYEELKENGEYLFSYENGDYEYKKDGIYYLVRNNKIIASGGYVNSYNNGDYKYEKNGTYYLVRNGETIASGEYIYSYYNGDYEYEKDGIYYLVRNNEIIASGEYVFSYDNGDYEYKKDGTRYLIRNCKVIASGEYVNSYNNGDYEYKKDGTWYLVRDGETIASGEFVHSYNSGDYEYKKYGIYYRYNKNHELLDEYKNVVHPIQYNPLIQQNKHMTYEELIESGNLACSYNNGDYEYEKDGTSYLVRNNEIIASGKFVNSYDNGDYKYKKDSKTYVYNKNHELLDENDNVIHPIQYNPLIQQNKQEDVTNSVDEASDIESEHVLTEKSLPLSVENIVTLGTGSLNEDIRTFESGATRNSDTNKLDYEGFNSPIVDWYYAQYMHSHRFLENGAMRDSDNWQKGIPKEQLIKSLVRHVMDARLIYRDVEVKEKDILMDKKDILCGIIFNAKALLLEELRDIKSVDRNYDK